MSNPIHKTILVKYFNITEYEIDEEIAELFPYLWNNKIETSLSCQDNVPKNYIWIMFDDYYSFNNFMNIVIENTSINEYERILYPQKYSKKMDI